MVSIVVHAELIYVSFSSIASKSGFFPRMFAQVYALIANLWMV
jgi:hypothetical protein